MTFKETRERYEQKREDERKALANFLKDYPEIKGVLKVITHWKSGKGNKNYTSGKRIAPYDLSNWKWVELKDKRKEKSFSCVISLNMPDVDAGSGNPHALFDRVGLLVSYHKDGVYYETAVHPDINLPLDEDDKDKPEEEKLNKDKERIAQLVIKQHKIFCENKNKKKEA